MHLRFAFDFDLELSFDQVGHQDLDTDKTDLFVDVKDEALLAFVLVDFGRPVLDALLLAVLLNIS